MCVCLCSLSLSLSLSKKTRLKMSLKADLVERSKLSPRHFHLQWHSQTHNYIPLFQRQARVLTFLSAEDSLKCHKNTESKAKVACVAFMSALAKHTLHMFWHARPRVNRTRICACIIQVHLHQHMSCMIGLKTSNASILALLDIGTRVCVCVCVCVFVYVYELPSPS